MESGVQLAEGIEVDECKRFAEEIKDEIPLLNKEISNIRGQLDNSIIAQIEASV